MQKNIVMGNLIVSRACLNWYLLSAEPINKGECHSILTMINQDDY